MDANGSASRGWYRGHQGSDCFFCPCSASQAPKSASPKRTVLGFIGSYYYSSLDFPTSFLPFLPGFSLLLESQSEGLVVCLCIMGFFARVLCWIRMCCESGVRSSWQVMPRVPIVCCAFVHAVSVPRAVTGRRMRLLSPLICSFPTLLMAISCTRSCPAGCAALPA